MSKIVFKKSIIGSAIAFIIATSCCWLPAFIIAIGGGSTLLAVSNGLEKFSGLFIAVGVVLLAYGLYQFMTRKNSKTHTKVILDSIITCPECGIKKSEKMPVDACQYFYECESCKVVLKPVRGDCCVFCSYGSVVCPPIQLNEDCC